MNGGSNNYIGGGRNNTMGSGADTCAIYGGWENNLGSGHTDTIVGGRGNIIRNRNTNAEAGNGILFGRRNILESNNMDQNFIIGGAYNTVSGSIDQGGIIASSGSLAFHDRSIIIGGAQINTQGDDEVYVPKLVSSGSLTHAGGLFAMEPWATLPAAASHANTFAVSGSKPYFSDGTSWNALF
jgi:hypothetical protein